MDYLRNELTTDIIDIFRILCDDTEDNIHDPNKLYLIYAKNYINLMTNTNIEKTKYILKCLIYGVAKEYLFKKLIHFIPLKNAPLHFSRYDFYSPNMFYELKNLFYSLNKYQYCVLNVDKCRYNNLCIIFGFNEVNETDGQYTEYYYIQYDKNRFNTYNKRTIKTGNTPNYVYDILKKDLIPITKNGELTTEFIENGFILNYNLNNDALTYEHVKEYEIIEKQAETQELIKIKNHPLFNKVVLI